MTARDVIMVLAGIPVGMVLTLAYFVVLDMMGVKR